ncbi:MAG: hypothetical protein U0703_17785 [Anaerolineae bacterium]
MGEAEGAGCCAPTTAFRYCPSNWRWLIVAGGCWLVIRAERAVLLRDLCILGAWGAWRRGCRRFPVALFGRCVVAAGITLPCSPSTRQPSFNPAFAAWSAQNLLASPPPLQYVLAYLPLGLLATFGIRRIWRQPDSRGVVDRLGADRAGTGLPADQRAAPDGQAMIVPLAILAAKRGCTRWRSAASPALVCAARRSRRRC